MANEQVLELLDHYLDPTTESYGAVLLTGPWGAGKTHFIKKYLADRADRMRKANPNDTLTHLYVSLYGIQSFSEVQNQFFAQTNPALNSGPVRLLGLVAARAINVATRGQGVKEDDATAIQAFFARSLKGLVLVFDDLERCAIPLVEMMGFINTFVEHEGAKVIVLAAEDEIPKEQKESYRARKEKLVSKTAQVMPDAPAVYDIFVEELRHPSARAAAGASRAAALRTFEASGINNLRSLRSALHDFDRLVATVDSRLAESQDALHRLLLHMIAISLEFRAARINEADIGELGMAMFWESLRSTTRRTDSDDRDQLATVAAKYPDVHWSDSVIPPEVLSRLMVRGVLDKDAANAVLGEHPLVVGLAATPSWRRMWRWFEMNSSEYTEVRALFLDDLAHHRIVEPGPLLHAIGTIISLLGYEDDLLAGQDPVDFFRGYLADLEASGKLEPDVDPNLHMDRSSWGGLGYSSIDTDAFRAARDELDAAVTRAIEAKVKARAPELLAQLQSQESYPLLSEFGPSAADFGGVAILHNIDVARFADLGIVDGAFNTELIGALLRRYHQRSHRLKAEIPWVQALEEELMRRAALEAPPRRRRLPGTVTYWFDAIRKELGIGSRLPTANDDPTVGS